LLENGLACGQGSLEGDDAFGGGLLLGDGGVAQREHQGAKPRDFE
jgi:hypothetical protein